MAPSSMRKRYVKGTPLHKSSPTAKGAPHIKANATTPAKLTPSAGRSKRRNSSLSYASSHKSHSKNPRSRKKKKGKGKGNPVWGVLAGALTAYVGSLNVVPDRFDSLYFITALYLILGGIVTLMREGYRQKASTARSVYPTSIYTLMEIMDGDNRYGLFLMMLAPFLIPFGMVGKLTFLITYTRGVSLADGIVGSVFSFFFRRRRKRKSRRRHDSEYSSEDSYDEYDSESSGYDSLSGSSLGQSGSEDDSGSMSEYSDEEFSQASGSESVSELEEVMSGGFDSQEDIEFEEEEVIEGDEGEELVEGAHETDVVGKKS